MLRTMWRKQARIRCFPREKQGIRVVETRNPYCSKGLCQNPASEHLADPRKSRVFVPGAQPRLERSDRPAEFIPVPWGSPDGHPDHDFAPSPSRSALVARLETRAGASLRTSERSYQSKSIQGLDAGKRSAAV